MSMMQTEIFKIVDFNKWCPLCQNKDKKEEDKPCDECLEYATNLYSTKPVMWKEKEAK